MLLLRMAEWFCTRLFNCHAVQKSAIRFPKGKQSIIPASALRRGSVWTVDYVRFSVDSPQKGFA